MLTCEHLARVWYEQNITTSQATAELLYGVLTAQLKSTFHKINVHAAMTPADIQKYFKPVFEQANALKEAFERRAQSEQQAATSQVSKTYFACTCVWVHIIFVMIIYMYMYMRMYILLYFHL